MRYRYNTVWYGANAFECVRYGTVQCCIVWYGTARYGNPKRLRHCTVPETYGTIPYDTVHVLEYCSGNVVSYNTLQYGTIPVLYRIVPYGIVRYYDYTTIYKYRTMRQ